MRGKRALNSLSPSTDAVVVVFGGGGERRERGDSGFVSFWWKRKFWMVKKRGRDGLAGWGKQNTQTLV